MAGIGGTVDDLLGVCDLLDNESEFFAGGRDETRAIRALTQAQMYFESLAATYADVLTSTVTVNTAAATESSTIPASLRRIDGMWYLDASGRPAYEMDPIDQVGGHVPSLPWPITVTNNPDGTPMGYYATWDHFYWLSRPDGVYTMRIYGLVGQPAFSVRTDNFNYPAFCQLPLAQFAVKLLALGVDDTSLDLDRLASQVYGPVLKQLSHFDRSRPMARVYSHFHDT